jgi:hypothetical protein
LTSVLTTDEFCCRAESSLATVLPSHRLEELPCP